MTQYTGDHASSYAADTVGLAIWAERNKIALWLEDMAKIARGMNLASTAGVYMAAAFEIRSGTYQQKESPQTDPVQGDQT
jgi:hypothetical protein